jgi:hypothetical protein
VSCFWLKTERYNDYCSRAEPQGRREKDELQKLKIVLPFAKGESEGIFVLMDFFDHIKIKLTAEFH